MIFCTKLQKNPEMFAQFIKKLYLCIRNKRKKAVFHHFMLLILEGSLGEWLKPPVC